MTVKPISAVRRNTLWVQVIGGTGSMLTLLLCGAMAGWTSPYLAKLTADDSPIPVTSDEGSWIAALMNMGRLAGAIPGALSVYYFGSRKTLLLNGIPFVLSWISLIAADSVVWLYVSRTIGGFAMGVTYGSFPLYLGEVSSPAIRGALVTYASIGLPVGSVLGSWIGTYVSVSAFAYICLVPTAILIFIFMWVPESPHWLIRVGKTREAKQSITRYNPGVDVEAEVKSLEDFVSATQSITFVDKLREFSIPANRKAGMFIVVLFVFRQFTGLNSVLLYIEIILTDGGLTVVRPATMVTLAGAAGIVAALVAVYLNYKLERKTLWNISSSGTTVTMAAFGIHFSLLYSGYDPADLQWLMILSILAYEMFLFIGISPIPNTLLSELFAPNIKSIAACFASITVGLFSFISSKAYQPLLDATSEAVVFWAHAAIAALALIFGLIFMPKTKGKSLQQIQNMLHKSS